LKFCSESFHDDTDSRFVLNFHGIVHREVGETMRCFADRKKARKIRFFGAISRRFGGGRQMFAEKPVTLCRPNWFQFAGVISEKK